MLYKSVSRQEVLLLSRQILNARKRHFSGFRFRMVRWLLLPLLAVAVLEARQLNHRDLPAQIQANIISGVIFLFLLNLVSVWNVVVGWLERWLVVVFPCRKEDFDYLLNFYSVDQKISRSSGCCVLVAGASSLVFSGLLMALGMPTDMVVKPIPWLFGIPILAVVVVPEYLKTKIRPLLNDLKAGRRSLDQVKRLLSFVTMSKASVPLLHAIFLLPVVFVVRHYLPLREMPCDWPSPVEQIDSMLGSFGLFFAGIITIDTCAVILLPMFYLLDRMVFFKYLAVLLATSILGLIFSVPISLFVSLCFSVWWSVIECSSRMTHDNARKILIFSTMGTSIGFFAILATLFIAPKFPAYLLVLIAAWGTLFIDGLSGSVLEAVEISPK